MVVWVALESTYAGFFRPELVRLSYQTIESPPEESNPDEPC